MFTPGTSKCQIDTPRDMIVCWIKNTCQTFSIAIPDRGTAIGDRLVKKKTYYWPGPLFNELYDMLIDTDEEYFAFPRYYFTRFLIWTDELLLDFYDNEKRYCENHENLIMASQIVSSYKLFNLKDKIPGTSLATHLNWVLVAVEKQNKNLSLIKNLIN
jgi:hypothetical protein